MTQEFPEIQSNGSLMLAWQVKGRKVLVIGGGEVAAGRILAALNADAHVTVICPSLGLNEEVAYRVAEKQVTHIDRLFQPSDLSIPTSNPTSTTTTNTNTTSPPPSPDPSQSPSKITSSSPSSQSETPSLVLCAVDDPIASSQIYNLCHEARIPANIADVPPECDFFFGSVHRDGPLQIMVSTNGNGPKLASIVRKQIASSLPENIGLAIEKVGMLRRKLRAVAPGGDQGKKRMQWMSKVCESWPLEDLCDMDDEDMELLLQFYKPGEVPTLKDLRFEEELAICAFDGSFGWV